MVNPFLIHSKDKVPEEPQLQEIFVDPELRKRVNRAEEEKLRQALERLTRLEYYGWPLVSRVEMFYRYALQHMSKADGPVEVASETFVWGFSVFDDVKRVRKHEFEAFLSRQRDSRNLYIQLDTIERSGQTPEQAMVVLHHNLVDQGRLKACDFVDIEAKDRECHHIPSMIILGENDIQDLSILYQKHGGRIPYNEIIRRQLLAGNIKMVLETKRRMAELVPDKSEEGWYTFLGACFHEWNEPADRVTWSAGKPYDEVKSGSVDRFRKSRVFKDLMWDNREEMYKVVNGFMTDHTTNMLRVGKDEYIVRFRGKGNRTKFMYMNIPDSEANQYRSKISGEYDLTGHMLSGPSSLDPQIRGLLGRRYTKFSPEKI